MSVEGERQRGPAEAPNLGTPSEPRPAASVVLLRRGGRHRDRALEVLLLKRTEEARFMPGVWVFPGGGLDAVDGEGEAGHRACAVRELAEETGYRAGRIVRLRDWFVSPGVFSERMFLFLCEDLQPGPTRLEADESLKSVIVPWDEALRMVHDGRIEDAKTMLALLLCDALRR